MSPFLNEPADLAGLADYSSDVETVSDFGYGCLPNHDPSDSISPPVSFGTAPVVTDLTSSGDGNDGEAGIEPGQPTDEPEIKREDGAPPEYDLSHIMTPELDREFETKKEALEYFQNLAKQHGFALKTRSSRNSSTRVAKYLSCTLGGKYRTPFLSRDDVQAFSERPFYTQPRVVKAQIDSYSKEEDSRPEGRRLGSELS
ncbi:hypothetical protein BGZ58_007669 [Dissophora ornata]|nr:hypothetical protein BGZ58_007669 [Dissophora ornata]